MASTVMRSLFRRTFPILFFLLLIPELLLSLQSGGPCTKLDLTKKVPNPCLPCRDTDWMELILREREAEMADQNDPAKEETDSCFNSFPLGTHVRKPKPEPLTKGAPEPDLNLEKTTRGFIVTRSPFFRFMEVPPMGDCKGDDYCPASCIPPDPNANATANADNNLDIAGVGKYYDLKNGYKVDLHLLEWPGKTHTETTEYLDANLNAQCQDGSFKKPYHCVYSDDQDSLHPLKFKTLKFVKEASKLLHYPCNKEEGMAIAAFGLMTIKNRDEKVERDDPHNTVYLMYNKSRIFHTYTAPLYVAEKVLEEMAKAEDAEPFGICRKVEPDCYYNDMSDFCMARQQYFLERGEIIYNDALCGGVGLSTGKTTDDTTGNMGTTDALPPAPVGPKSTTEFGPTGPTASTEKPVPCEGCKMSMMISDDLRTVLDFTFVQNRLILAMRCGIVVVEGLLVDKLNIFTAHLITSDGKHKNTFKPVTKIASNYCCKKKGCRSTVVAAYSAAPKVNLDNAREMYISYDLGNTFRVKLIADPQSTLNLIWGMYKMYAKWLMYYELLEHPDPEDMKDVHEKEIIPGYDGMRAKHDWDSLTTQEKENRVLYGEARDNYTDLEAAKTGTLRHILLRSTMANKRFARKRRNDETVNLDLSPMWLRNEIRSYRDNFDWKRPWTDSNCDSIPPCRRKFENDPAVTYFLNQSGVIVKTPKRAYNVPFCDQIVSIAVLEEQDSLYVLCLVGFGDFSKPKNDSNNPYPNPPCSSRQAAFYGPVIPDEVTEEPELETTTDYEATSTEDSETTESSTEDISGIGRRKREARKTGSNRFRRASSGSSTTEQCEYKRPGPDGTTLRYHYNRCIDGVKYYAIFTLSVTEKMPLVVFDERYTERLFTCLPLEVPLDLNGCKSLHVQPELIRLPNSITLLIKNCKNVLYYSPNGGQTVFNTEFYAVQSESSDEEDLKRSADNPCENNDTDSSAPPSPEHQRQLMYRLKSLAVPPQIETSPLGNVVLMTMGNRYAYGLLGGNKGFRMVVGKIFPTIEGNILKQVKSNDIAFPSFTMSGQPFFGVALKMIYSHNPSVNCHLYANRQGIRLVRMDPFLHKDAAYFYDENHDLFQGVRQKGLGLDVCHTLDFKVKPKEIRLDVGESAKVEVKSYDVRPNIPLSILSSDEKSNTVDVSLVEKTSDERDHLTHDWEVNINAIRNYKRRVTALSDSFFGVENNNMYGYHTQISLANDLEIRCHVQPAATVLVRTECRDKKLVAHEDSHRPQCDKGTFSKKVFTYTLKKGTFNPNLVAFWEGLDRFEKKEKKMKMKLDKKTGNLKIVYDYIRFGCPVEPYKDEPFIPDLRIATSNTSFNSTEGELYTGPFLLIELLGSTEFNFSETVRDTDCHFVPINLTEYIVDWVHRKQMFRIANSQQTSADDADIDIVKNAQTIDEILALQYGNQLFFADAVDHPLNIINRVTYRDCRSWRNFFLASENKTEEYRKNQSQINGSDEDLKKQDLPIMSRDGTNRVLWKKRKQPIYIFMAIALNPTESLCEYYTIFGVSIPNVPESPLWITLGIFLLLFLLWVLLFFCGYWWQRTRIRRMCIDVERKRRLEEAAWKVVYRYEKLLQQHENHNFEEEFKEFKEKEAEKDTLRSERKGN